MTANQFDDLAGGSLELLLIAKYGLTFEQAASEAAERSRIRLRAKEIENKPLDECPSFSIVWDLSPANFHFAIDGAEPGSLADKALLIVHVKLQDLDAVLHSYNLRTVDELWSVGDPRKAATIIIHCSEGGKLTPPWVEPSDDNKVRLMGGNHRLAVARAKNETVIPLLVERHHLEALTNLVPAASC